MDRTVAIILGVVAVAVVGGLVFYTVNKNGTSSPTATSTSTTGGNVGQTLQPAKPFAATHIKVATTDTTAIVNGIVTPNGSFTNYWYEYGTTASLGKTTSRQMIGSGYASIEVPGYITGLTKDTTYHFRVAAENQYGIARGSTYTFQTTHDVPPPVGSAPGASTAPASGISRTTANLNGEVTPNKATTQYWFEYGKTTNLGNTTALVSVGDGSTKTQVSLSLSGLDPNTAYHFRLNAQNKFGTVNGAILNFKTAGPSASASPSATTESATNVATTTATLRAVVDPQGASTTYWFEYSTDSLFGSVLARTTAEKTLGANSGAVSVTADISGLISSTTYFFRVVAENSVGLVRGSRVSFETN